MDDGRHRNTGRLELTQYSILRLRDCLPRPRRAAGNCTDSGAVMALIPASGFSGNGSAGSAPPSPLTCGAGRAEAATILVILASSFARVSVLANTTGRLVSPTDAIEHPLMLVDPGTVLEICDRNM